jgi:hypothetical protein
MRWMILDFVSGTEFFETFDKAAVMLNLIGDDQLAGLKVSDRKFVNRAIM